MADRFTGKVAVITGGASGIGAAVARRMASEGGNVVLWDLGEDRLAEAQEKVGARLTMVVDVSDAAAVAAAAREIGQELGQIDILVTCAGILGPYAGVDSLSLDDWYRMFAVNVHGVFHCIHAIVPMMRKRKYGRIVTLSSIVGKEAVAGSIAYGTAKAAVLMMTKILGKDLAAEGIIANSITPGPLKTPMIENLPPEALNEMMSTIPMGRLGSPDECAEMICFMASDACSFTTGAVFDLSGGRAGY